MAHADRLNPWIGGVSVAFTGRGSPLISPVDEAGAGEVAECDAHMIDRAVANAHAAYLTHRHRTPAERAIWLNDAAAGLERVEGPILESLIRMIGKPRRAATFEARRGPQFLRATAAQLAHMGGEVLPLDALTPGAGRFGFTTRIPYGAVAAITPFNAPVNLLVQKLAPAIAMGNAVVAKPSPPATEVALVIADVLKRAGVPDGVFNIVPGGRETALNLVAHPKIAAVTMTGGTAAGRELARAAGAKKFVAELGSNAANIVCADADLADAAQRIAAAAFEASGQQCISAQRIIVEAPVYGRFLELFVAAAERLKTGDPNDSTTDIGPMVSRSAADRVEQMIDDAVTRGAMLALAPRRSGCTLSPAIVAGAPKDARLLLEEAFGPVAIVISAGSVDDALVIANESEFGLQGACFTKSLDTAFKVSKHLQAGSLWINEASRFRLDSYPFGGVGASGYGREGVRYAMEELSQWKFTGIRL
jgi:acyl-CoA reductase-like NAD-dependent aldehyde dehydrogenase